MNNAAWGYFWVTVVSILLGLAAGVFMLCRCKRFSRWFTSLAMSLAWWWWALFGLFFVALLVYARERPVFVVLFALFAALELGIMVSCLVKNSKNRVKRE